MVKIRDSAREASSREREMLRLTAAASDRSRALFERFLSCVTKIEILDSLNLDDPASTAERAALEDRKARALERLEKRAKVGVAEALANLRMRLTQAHPECVRHLPKAELRASGPSYARLAWLISTTASGQNTFPQALRHCLDAGAQWYAESLIMLCVTPQESHRLAVAGRTSHTRNEFGSTKFRWIATLVADGVDAWASATGGPAAQYLGGGRTSALARLIDGADPWLHDADVVGSLHPVVRDALTAKHHDTSHLESLLESNEPELYPLVSSDGGARVGNATAFVFSLDLTLFSAIRSTLGSDAQGEAFEFLCAFICRRIGPRDAKIHQDSLVVDKKGMLKGDEVDVHIAGAFVDIVLECKSYLPARDSAAAANSFLNDLQAAHKQVDRRVTRLRNGAWIRDRQGGSEDAAAGLVVSLHDYSGEAWNVRALAEDGDVAFTALPVQSFTMVIGAMKSTAELREFLKLRQALIDIEAMGGDELEYLLAWLDGWTPDSLPDATGKVVQFRPYTVPMSTLIEAEYINRNAWRSLLESSRYPVHP